MICADSRQRKPDEDPLDQHHRPVRGCTPACGADPGGKGAGQCPCKAAPAAPVRRRITVSIQEVTDESWQINNAAELDAYIEKLRHALKQKLDNGDTLNVDIW